MNSPGAGKVENRARKTSFCTRNIPTTFWGAVLIVSRHYSQKMFQSSFEDFSVSGHHRNMLRADKVENWTRITPFCTQNIPTMFGVQFVSFLVNTAVKYFDRILTNFPGPESTRAGKPENRAQMTWFCT